MIIGSSSCFVMKVKVGLFQMEKYSKHLEVLVAERTQDLMHEKQKTDRLLYSTTVWFLLSIYILKSSCFDNLIKKLMKNKSVVIVTLSSYLYIYMARFSPVKYVAVISRLLQVCSRSK